MKHYTKIALLACASLILNFQFSIFNSAQAQVQGSVRDLAPHYGVRAEFLDDTLNLTRYLQGLNVDNHTLTDSCVSINARLTTMSLALQHDYRRRGDTLWLSTTVYATDYALYASRLSQLSAIALRSAYHYIERETTVNDSISHTELQLRLDTIRRNHNLIVSTCDGIGVRDKNRQKELKDIYYAYLAVYNRYDFSARQVDDEQMQKLKNFQEFQEDLTNDLLTSDNLPYHIANFTNVLRARCGRNHLDVLRSYQRVFRQNAEPVEFTSIYGFYDYIERLLDIRNWQSAYLTAIDLRDQMDSNSRRIINLYSKRYRKAADTYREVEATINAIPAFTNSIDANTFITNLDNFVNVVQQGYIDDYVRLDAIATHGDSIIRACSMRYSDVAKTYRHISQLYVIIPTYRTTDEAYRHRQNLYTFQTLQRQFDTILQLRTLIDAGRDTIADGWSSHMTIYNGYQNIRKQYNTPPSFVSIQGASQYITQLQEHRAIQRHCIMAINRYLVYQGSDAQIATLIKPYSNFKKAYSTLKNHYITVRNILRPEDILLYNQQYIDFYRIQQAFLKSLSSSDVAANDYRLKGITDPHRIELILGLSN